MRKLTLINYIAMAFVAYIVISGYKEGPAFKNEYECTGAETGLGNAAGCDAGTTGCHSKNATTAITIAVELDSAGVPTTQYFGGMKYTVKITGVNTTDSNLPKFGFQLGSIMGTKSLVTPTNAGTWPSPYPANVHYSAPKPGGYVVGVVEHGTQLPPASGTGGTGTTYVETVNWTAPGIGTGTVSIWGALNAVNFNDTSDNGDLWDTTHIVIKEAITDGVATLPFENNGVQAYPNPFTTHITFTLNAETNNARLTIYDISGREVKQMTFSGNQVVLEKDNLETGIYFYTIQKEDNSITSGKIIVR